MVAVLRHMGETAVARSDIGGTGTVFVRGELWNAESDEAIAVGETVEVVAVEGLRLKVRRRGSS